MYFVAVLFFFHQLGGLNSLLEIERNQAIPIVSMVPTIIFGMDVSHGAPRSNVPSIAAVCNGFLPLFFLHCFYFLDAAQYETHCHLITNHLLTWDLIFLCR